LVENQTV